MCHHLYTLMILIMGTVGLLTAPRREWAKTYSGSFGMRFIFGTRAVIVSMILL